MMIPLIFTVAILLVFIGNSVPPMGLLGLAALVAAIGILLHAYVACVKLIQKTTTETMTDEPDLRHHK